MERIDVRGERMKEGKTKELLSNYLKIALPVPGLNIHCLHPNFDTKFMISTVVQTEAGSGRVFSFVHDGTNQMCKRACAVVHGG